jgi:hypothetical protein
MTDNPWPSMEERSRWDVIKATNDLWAGITDTNTATAAVGPYVAFVNKLKKGFNWYDRLYILFTGRMPEDF